MESNAEFMIVDKALMIPRKGPYTPGVTLGSYQVQGERGHELNTKLQGQTFGLCCGYDGYAD